MHFEWSQDMYKWLKLRGSRHRPVTHSTVIQSRPAGHGVSTELFSKNLQDLSIAETEEESNTETLSPVVELRSLKD